MELTPCPRYRIIQQIECYVENWLIAMREICAEIRVFYDAVLARGLQLLTLSFTLQRQNCRALDPDMSGAGQFEPSVLRDHGVIVFDL